MTSSSTRLRVRSEQLCDCGCGECTFVNKSGKPNRYLFGHNARGGRCEGQVNDEMPVHPVLQAFRNRQKDA